MIRTVLQQTNKMYLQFIHLGKISPSYTQKITGSLQSIATELVELIP